MTTLSPRRSVSLLGLLALVLALVLPQAAALALPDQAQVPEHAQGPDRAQVPDHVVVPDEAPVQPKPQEAEQPEEPEAPQQTEQPEQSEQPEQPEGTEPAAGDAVVDGMVYVCKYVGPAHDEVLKRGQQPLLVSVNTLRNVVDSFPDISAGDVWTDRHGQSVVADPTDLDCPGTEEPDTSPEPVDEEQVTSPDGEGSQTEGEGGDGVVGDGEDDPEGEGEGPAVDDETVGGGNDVIEANEGSSSTDDTGTDGGDDDAGDPADETTGTPGDVAVLDGEQERGTDEDLVIDEDLDVLDLELGDEPQSDGPQDGEAQDEGDEPEDDGQQADDSEVLGVQLEQPAPPSAEPAAVQASLPQTGVPAIVLALLGLLGLGAGGGLLTTGRRDER